MSAHRPTSSHARTYHDMLIGFMNVGIAIIALTALLYYVVQANTLASATWRINDAHTQLASLRIQHDGLIAQQAALEDRATLQQLAIAEGMVPAQSVVYVVPGGAVAAR